MAKFLAFFIISIALVFNPVLGQLRDIQVVCDQTPGMQLFGQLLRQYPDIYAIYANKRNSTIYVPSDQALQAHYANTSHIFRRKDPSTAQANYQLENKLNDMNSWPKKMLLKRAVGDAERSVRFTADTQTSPTGRNSVIVKVNSGPGASNSKRQLQIPNTSQSTGITFYTGAGETSNILFGDIQCTQGYAHVVDAVFQLPQPVTDTLQATNRTSFLSIIRAANLENDYNQADQITIFAPINSAFENQSTLNTAEIEYHVINDVARYTPDLKDGDVIQTAQGQNLYVTAINNTFYINCVRVVQTDAITNNGVIHAVEKILTPLPSPPYCGGASISSTNSTGVVPYTGSGLADKAVNMMAVVGTVFAVICFII